MHLDFSLNTIRLNFVTLLGLGSNRMSVNINYCYITILLLAINHKSQIDKAGDKFSFLIIIIIR